MQIDEELEGLLRQAIAALRMSSPNTDSLHRWQNSEWVQQRSDAIEQLEQALRTAKEPSAPR